MMVVKFGSILLCVGLSVSQSIPSGDSRFFMTEEVRVKRQAGYVYNRPSVSFDLPSRPPPPSPPPTQAPTVDRAPTQAQQMYYAYPVPATAPGGNSLNPGATGGQQPGGTSGGYNYSPQTVGGQASAPAGGGQGAAPAGQQSSTSGYNYNAGGQSGSGFAGASAAGSVEGGSAQAGAGSQGTGGAGYSYNAPTAGTGSAAGSQASTSGATQTLSSASAQASAGSQAGTGSGSGYSYQVPNPTLQPNLQTEVSTNAPKYLPPTGSAGGSADAGGTANDIPGDGGVQAPAPPPPPPTGGASGYGAGGTGQSAIPAPPIDQYLPPLPQIPSTENTLQNPNANAAGNIGTQTGSVSSGSSAAYIPPATGARPSPAADVTPRPFAPPPTPPTPAGYLPPNVNNDASSGQGALSTPASTYLPPVL